MTKSISNVEIEDVLASIRRLVSATPEEAGETDARIAPVSDRLVLTPAQRVVSGRPVEPATEDMADEVEPETADDLQDPLAETHAEEDNSTALADDVDAADAPKSDEPAPRRIEETLAELEAAVDDAAFTWEPDVDVTASEALTDAATPVIDLRPNEGEARFASTRARPQADPAPDHDDDSAAPDDLDSYLGELGSMDEDALRALVAEMIRSELRGPLGERITRNVRKLVRREIYRVLSSQDLD